MAKRNNTRRKTKKELKRKSAPPAGLIAAGIGIVLIGVAALFLMPQPKSSASADSHQDEYSSVPVKVDFAAPELSLRNVVGEPESLEDYHGQVVMVNLWATWCPPCIAEIPMLQEYYEDHHAEDFVMLGIDSQEKPEKVAEYIKATGVTYPIWIDEKGKAGRAFNSSSLPASFVIDREGIVRLAWTGQISRAMLEEHLTPLIEQ